jgi:Xaa-Pro aminopeptidase
MPFDVAEVQRALAAEGVDGWLLYDFHGSNPIARSVTGLEGSNKLTTRRWYYLLPAKGEPRALVHAIESQTLDHLPGAKLVYAGRAQLEAQLRTLLNGCRRVAMEYSPGCAIPYVSRVDGGTIELVKGCGTEIVSSGDLVQRFEAVWSAEAYETHRAASDRLYRIKDRAFATVRQRLAAGKATSEFELQQMMMDGFREEGLITASPPIVAAQEHAGDPHYGPSAEHPRRIAADELLLLDLWGKLPTPGAVYADITWMGYTGRVVPDQYARPFAVICAARDAAVSLVEEGTRKGADVRGWQVDRAARDVIEKAGFGKQFVHRTGHSLGEEVHGNGVHMDDYETHDDRRLIAGTGFTIEPGLYTDRFGVRTEINMFVGAREATVTGPRQTEIVTLAD